MGIAFKSAAGRLAGVVLIAVGCDRAPDPKPPPFTVPVAQATTQAPDKSAKPVSEIETGAFFLSARSGQDAYPVGTEGLFAIHLEGRGPWHVNQEYPFRIELSGPEAAGLTKDRLVKEDAARWNENEAHFDVQLKPNVAGLHTLSCEVSFSMCTDEQCILETRTLALNLAVQ